jgi:hypothetical protein
MKSVNTVRSAAGFLLAANAILLQSAVALGGTPADDAQAQARALLSRSIVQSSAVGEPYRLAAGNRPLDAADDAHGQARRLLLGINFRDRAPNSVFATNAASKKSGAVGDAQDAARRMILGSNEPAGRLVVSKADRPID